MSSKEIEFVSTQDVTIKCEDIDQDQTCNQSWISYSPDYNCDKKCGEIFILNFNQLRFVCVFCNGSYDKICDFGVHLRQHNFKFLENLSSDTQAAEGENAFIVKHIQHTIEEVYTCDDVLFRSSTDPNTRKCSNQGEQDILSSNPSDITSYSLGGITNIVENPNTIKSHACKLCKKEFRNARNLRRHTCRDPAASIPDKAVNDHTCSACKKKYASKRNLKRHNCRGNESAHHQTAGSVDTEEKSNDIIKSDNGTNCMNFLSEQRENFTGSIADSNSKDENKCEEPSGLSPSRKDGELFNVLVKDGIELVECRVCNKLFESVGRLNRHKCLQTAKKYKCNSCGNRYVLGESIEKHRCPAQSANPNIVNPDPTNNVETRVHTVEVKRSSTEDKITNPELYCDICKKQLKFKHSFRRHGMLHKEPPSAMRTMPDYLKCEFCGMKVTKHTDWLPHERTHSSQFRHVCPYCSKVFKWGMSLKVHINCHTGERPYKCDQCPASFAHSTNLLAHKRRLHLKHRPHECSYCPVKCVTRSELRQHMKRHTGDKAYQCEVCGKSFITATNLSEHFRIHTNIKNVKCPLCSMAFIHKKRLALHMITHSNEKRHTCDVCGAKFSRNYAMLVHKKLHQPEKEYVCPICGKAFAQAAGLYSHKKSHDEIFG